MAKYTKQILEEAAKNSYSINDVLRFLKIKITGGSFFHIKKQLKKFNIDKNQNFGNYLILKKRINSLKKTF